MADNDDKREDTGGKKTLSLKGSPNLGGNRPGGPGMGRPTRGRGGTGILHTAALSRSSAGLGRLP